MIRNILEKLLIAIVVPVGITLGIIEAMIEILPSKKNKYEEKTTNISSIVM
jgi:hypothetical protein